jgi:hypothetical protein
VKRRALKAGLGDRMEQQRAIILTQAGLLLLFLLFLVFFVFF